MSNKYLEVTNLKKSFGGIKAVDVQSLNLNRNELTSIIGPNGAGKTTFFDLISGFQDSDEGKVYLNKKNITRSQPYSIARLGMIRTFQLTKVFDRMTVLENMMFSASTVNNDSFLKSLVKLSSQKTTEKKIRDKSFEIMKELINTNKNLILEKSIKEVIDDFLLSYSSIKTKNRYKTVLKQFFDEINILSLAEL